MLNICIIITNLSSLQQEEAGFLLSPCNVISKDLFALHCRHALVRRKRSSVYNVHNSASGAGTLCPHYTKPLWLLQTPSRKSTLTIFIQQHQQRQQNRQNNKETRGKLWGKSHFHNHTVDFPSHRNIYGVKSTERAITVPLFSHLFMTLQYLLNFPSCNLPHTHYGKQNKNFVKDATTHNMPPRSSGTTEERKRRNCIAVEIPPPFVKFSMFFFRTFFYPRIIFWDFN